MRYVIQQKLLEFDLICLKCKFSCKIYNSTISFDKDINFIHESI